MVRLTDRFIFLPMSLEVLGLDWTVERVRILSVDKTFSSAAARASWAFFSSLRTNEKKHDQDGFKQPNSFSFGG